MRPSRTLADGSGTLSGILLLDKPTGLSSNAALQQVRHLAGRIKAGHTGSLDPLASGMLPICLGEATKLAGELLAGAKVYEFDLLLGERSDTVDAEGSVVETLPVPPLTHAQIQGGCAVSWAPSSRSHPCTRRSSAMASRCIDLPGRG